MNVMTINILVSKISYQYCLHGDIIPYVNMFPSLTLDTGEQVSKFPLYHTQHIGDASTVTEGDEILLTIDTDKQQRPLIRIINYSDKPRFDHNCKVCPICGSPLFMPTVYLSMGRCLNRSCMAQMSTTVLHFISKMGINSSPVFSDVLMNTLSRGCIYSLSQLFKLVPEDVVTAYINILDGQQFLFNLHYIRGKVTINDLIRGIRIPYWTENDYVLMDKYLIENNINLNNAELLFKPSILIDGLNMDHFHDLFSLYSNRKLFMELAWILRY